MAGSHGTQTPEPAVPWFKLRQVNTAVPAHYFSDLPSVPHLHSGLPSGGASCAWPQLPEARFQAEWVLVEFSTERISLWVGDTPELGSKKRATPLATGPF